MPDTLRHDRAGVDPGRTQGTDRPARDKGLRIANVALRARDPVGLAAFYRTALGLASRDGEDGAVGLGEEGRSLLTLLPTDAPRPRDHRTAGLFHTAFLLPDRASLARWARHAIATGLPLIGASDHNVSEALYLSDPEGNGIEVYADRPRSAWHDADGALHLPSDPLDMADLLAAAPADPWAGFPKDAGIGHVHLQVGAIPQAEAFWSGLIGLDITTRYRGGTFYGAGGYHHHVATNIWNSRGAGPVDQRTIGLAELTFHLPDHAAADGIAARADEAGAGVRRDGDDIVLRDPWGIGVRIGT